MKILFLDIDGVLATGRSIMARGYDGQSNKGFDPIACELIQKICDKFGYTLVISSTWANLGKDKVKEVLLASEITAPIHDDWKTPRKMSSSRLHEINMWIDDHPEFKPQDMLIIDDMPCSKLSKLGCCVITCDGDIGFSMEDYRKVFSHNNEKFPLFLM